jgi:hypothetical protein
MIFEVIAAAGGVAKIISSYMISADMKCLADRTGIGQAPDPVRDDGL